MVGLHIYRVAGDGALILEGANAAADNILGVQHSVLLGKRMEEAFPAFCAANIPLRCQQMMAAGGAFSDGNISYALPQKQAMLNLSAFSIAPDRMALVFQDVVVRQQEETERAHLLEQLTQASKLECMGRLAGGVVHDFNNLLQGIMGQIELCRIELGAGHPVRAHLHEIACEAQRSARLVKQLLSFVSRQAVDPQRLEINEAVSSMLKLLQRLLGEDIELVWQPDVSAGSVYMDSSQFDQILINLAINARDAIQSVGRLTIETHHVTLDDNCDSALTGRALGEYARLTMRDTGCGMDVETQARIFDPFFTTKPDGQGTGLGLATVHRIIQENGGFISVQSTHGQGSVFEIYLPRLEADVTASINPQEAQPLVGGSETILLVEDEKIIRLTTCRMLQRLGYTVLVAESPEEALRLVAEHKAPINLLLTDVVLPGMTGRDLASQLTKEFATLKCLFMSGHTADVVANRGRLEDDMHFIAKPFSRDSFARKLREVLDA